MKIVTIEEMRALERAADASGLSYDQMMENAGRAAAEAINDRVQAGRVLILIGPGNNGGDGLVVARHLANWHYAVQVYVWKRDRTPDPNLEKVREMDIPVLYASEDEGYAELEVIASESNVVVDALLGTGAKGPLRENLIDLLDHLQRGMSRYAGLPPLFTHPVQEIEAFPELCDAPWDRPLVVALDTPSGLDCDTGEIDPAALRADWTVTFAYPKRGLLCSPGIRYRGRLLVADIAIDEALAADISLELATAELIAAMLPKRPLDGHKGTFGKTMVVAGCTNYVGAPCLAAEAAYRCGGGLVTLGVAAPIYPIVAAKLWEPTFLVLPHDMGVLSPTAIPILRRELADYQALLIGPGLGTEDTTGDFVWGLLTDDHKTRQMIGFGQSRGRVVTEAPAPLPPTVIDADGLNLLAKRPNWWQHVPGETVLTPHLGEMARLLDCTAAEVGRDRIKTAQHAAAKWGCTVLLKGAHTVLAAADGRTLVLPFANPALATAGSGDVLAGTIAGLLGQGMRGYEAAACGAYLHGTAGEIQAETMGQAGILAHELLVALPRALHRLRQLNT